MFIMKTFDILFVYFFIKYAPRAFLLNIDESLFRSCILIVY
mgnify:FL=1